jgi:hypothetical protein
MTGHIREGTSMTDLDKLDEPTCEKCGAPITTGLMAAFCPRGKDCEFWNPAVDEFMAEFRGENRE